MTSEQQKVAESTPLKMDDFLSHAIPHEVMRAVQCVAFCAEQGVPADINRIAWQLREGILKTTSMLRDAVAAGFLLEVNGIYSVVHQGLDNESDPCEPEEIEPIQVDVVEPEEDVKLTGDTPKQQEAHYGIIPVSVVRHTRQVTDLTHTTLGTVIQSIRHGGNDLPSKTAKVRDLLNDPAAKRKFKDRQLPAVVTSGLFTYRNSSWKNLQEHSGVVCLDFDHSGDVEALVERAIARTTTIAAFRSPSGDGVKVFVRITPIPTSTPEHEHAYLTAQEAYAPIGDVKSDRVCRNLDRLCYLAYDPNAFVDFSRKTGIAWELPPPIPTPEPESKASTSRKTSLKRPTVQSSDRRFHGDTKTEFSKYAGKTLKINGISTWKDHAEHPYQVARCDCPFDSAHTNDAVLTYTKSGKPGFKCHHNSCADRDLEAVYNLRGIAKSDYDPNRKRNPNGIDDKGVFKVVCRDFRNLGIPYKEQPTAEVKQFSDGHMAYVFTNIRCDTHADCIGEYSIIHPIGDTSVARLRRLWKCKSVTKRVDFDTRKEVS